MFPLPCEPPSLLFLHILLEKLTPFCHLDFKELRQQGSLLKKGEIELIPQHSEMTQSAQKTTNFCFFKSAPPRTCTSDRRGFIFAAQTGVASRYVKDCHHYKTNTFCSQEQKHTPENLKYTSPTSVLNISEPWGTLHCCPAGIQWHQKGGK